MLLDLGELEEKPSDQLPGFTERLVALLPSLESHRCSLGRPGGFIERLHRGTWAGHIVEHVALELQCLAGMEVGFGKTRSTAAPGVYTVVFRYRAESVGLQAARRAVDLVEACIEGATVNLPAILTKLKELRERHLLGPSTAGIVDEARSRGIPTMRLNTESLVQLGYGVKQRRIQATMTDRCSAMGVEIADEKILTKAMLAAAGIPVPTGECVSEPAEALKEAEGMGWPVVVKPAIGNHGRGITVGVATPRELEIAYAAAQRVCSEVIVEQQLTGDDFRLLTIDYKLVAAARRRPAHVVGDGTATVAELIERLNADPRRGFGHQRMLTQVTVDAMTERLLAHHGMGLSDVPAAGQVLGLKSTANLSTGGTALDVTEEVHPEVRFMAERIARIVGLDCMGIDVVAPDLRTPLDPRTGGVVEVNAAPGFRMHLSPTEGEPRNVAAPFVDMLFPPGSDFVLPIVAVTGTNGKTTTTRLIAHTLKFGGRVVGLAGTNGVEIDGTLVAQGDFSGPAGSRMVLAEPTVDHAVLEVARGGILRRGLGFASCQVGILLNVTSDHLGVDGVDTLDDLADVKATVVEVVEPRGTSVLNADDEIVVGLRERAEGNLVFFSSDPNNPVVEESVAAGGTAVVVKDGRVVLRKGKRELVVLSIHEAPITFGGTARFNVDNVLAAVAALDGLGLSIESIRNGVMTFHPSATQNPGRMNLFEFPDYRVLVDYGHNVPAIEALAGVLGSLASGRKLVVAHGTGSRTEDAIREFGAALAGLYDEIIVTDIDARSRPAGETAGLVKEGALAEGFPAQHLHVVLDLKEAIDRAFSWVAPSDILVVQVDEVEPVIAQVLEYLRRP